MSESTNSTESKTETTNSGYSDDVKKTDDVNVEGNKDNTEDAGLDEYGYKKSDEDKSSDSEDESKKVVEDKVDDKSKEDIKPATGYEDSDNDSTKDQKVETKSEEDKKSDDEKKSDEEKLAQTKTDITESLNALPEGYSKEKVLDFAIKNSLSNDQVKAYIEMEKVAQVDYKQSQAEAAVAQKKAFMSELKLDATFGGENFAQSVKSAENVLENHFPNFKKALTDKDGMVPPYIMKDLLALNKVLNPTTTLVGGEPIVTKTEGDDNYLDTMYQ